MLSTTERTARLEALERIMHAQQDGFYSFVTAYMAIRDEELFKDAGFSSFPEYLQQRWGRAYSYRLLHSADVVAQLSTLVDDSQKLNVITKPAHATALATVPEPLRLALLELLNSTVVDKPTAAKIGKIGKVLEGVLEELQRTGTISVTEEDQLPAAAIPAITSAVLLELRESNYRQLQHLTDLQAKREPVYERSDAAEHVLNWRILSSNMHLAPDAAVTVKVFANKNGYTIRVEQA